jgi:prevent-host-death family protein
MAWPLAEAKNRFSEVFEKALKEGPQRVSRRGKERVVVVSEVEYERLAKRKTHRARGKDMDFVEFLLSARGLGPLEPPDRNRPSRAPARQVRF